MNSTEKKIALFRNIFCIISFLSLAAGIACTILDYQNSTALAQDIKQYKVIHSKSLEYYRNLDEKDNYLVTNIRITGDLISDTMNVLAGDYYYIHAKGQRYYADSKDNNNWIDDPEKDQYSKNIIYTEVDNKIPVNNISLYGIPRMNLENVARPEKDKFVKGYDYYPDEVRDEEGTQRYTFYAIPKNAAVSAIVCAGYGTIEVKKLISDRNQYYVYGDEHALYRYLEDYLVGNSLIYLAIGVVLSMISLFIAFILSEKEKKQNITRKKI